MALEEHIVDLAALEILYDVGRLGGAAREDHVVAAGIMDIAALEPSPASRESGKRNPERGLRAADLRFRKQQAGSLLEERDHPRPVAVKHRLRGVDDDRPVRAGHRPKPHQAGVGFTHGNDHIPLGEIYIIGGFGLKQLNLDALELQLFHDGFEEQGVVGLAIGGVLQLAKDS